MWRCMLRDRIVEVNELPLEGLTVVYGPPGSGKTLVAKAASSTPPCVGGGAVLIDEYRSNVLRLIREYTLKALGSTIPCINIAGVRVCARWDESSRRIDVYARMGGEWLGRAEAPSSIIVCGSTILAAKLVQAAGEPVVIDNALLMCPPGAHDLIKATVRRGIITVAEGEHKKFAGARLVHVAELVRSPALSSR